MSSTVPTEIAAVVLGVHPHTIRNWTKRHHIVEAVPQRGPLPARYEIAELRRWVRECTDGHGLECPVHHEPFVATECQCVARHCGPDFTPGGFHGSCARCHRPLVRGGQVVR